MHREYATTRLNRRTFVASTLAGGAALATTATLSRVVAQDDPEAVMEEAGFAGLEFVVNTDGTELRTAPGTSENAEVVRTLNVGDVVYTLDPVDHTPGEGVLWLSVTLLGGEITGFVSANLVDFAEDAEGMPTGAFVTIMSDEAILRSSPTQEAEVIQDLTAGEIGVTIGPSSTDSATGLLWYPIAAGIEAQWRGWIDGSVLAEDDGNGDIVITVLDGPLLVREAPGTGSAAFDTVETGAELPLGGAEPEELDGFTWILVTVEATGSEGWVAAEFTDYVGIQADVDAVATPMPDATPDATPEIEAVPDATPRG